jgi:hypothetical protein
MIRRHDHIEHPKVPWGWRLWFAFCALVSLTVIGVVLWAIVKLVNRYG